MSRPEYTEFPNPRLLTTIQKRTMLNNLSIMLEEGAITGEEYQRRVEEYDDRSSIGSRLRYFLLGKIKPQLNYPERKALYEMAERMSKTNDEDMPPERFARIPKP